MSDTITLLNRAGSPARDVAGVDVLRLELVTDRANPPETITVDVTTDADSQQVELTKAISADGTTVYQSKPFTLNDSYGELGWSGDLGLDFREGESVAFSEGGTTTRAFVYQQRGHRDISVARSHLAAAEKQWVGAYQDLRGFEQTPEVIAATAEARSWLDYIGFLRAEMAEIDDDKLGAEAYLARGIVRSVPLDPIAHFTSGAGRMNGANRDEWSRWVSSRRAGHKAYLRSAYVDMWADISIGSYQMITDYTSTAQLYTIITGQSVMGQDVGNEGRLEAAADLVIGYVTGKAVDKGIDYGMDVLVNGFSLSIGGRAGGRPDVAIPTRPVGSHPDVDVTGARVDHNAYGIRDVAAARYRAAVEAHGVHPVVRPASPEAMVFQGMGCPGKDTRVKNKTIKEVDTYIGGPKTSPIPNGPDAPNGLVGAFRPELPHRPSGVSDADWEYVTKGVQRADGMSDEAWSAMTKEYKTRVDEVLSGYSAPGVSPEIAAQIPNRFAQRMNEWTETSTKLRKLEEQGLIELRDGLIIDTGLYGGTGLPVTGDYDLFAIVDAAGNHVSPDVARSVVDFLSKFPETYTLHGAHVNWPDEMPFKSEWERTAIYEKIITTHETEALLVFGGMSGGAGVATHSRDGVVITKDADGKLIWKREAPVPYRSGTVLDSGAITLRPIAEMVSGMTKTLTDDAASGTSGADSGAGSEDAFDRMADEAAARTDALDESLSAGDDADPFDETSTTGTSETDDAASGDTGSVDALARKAAADAARDAAFEESLWIDEAELIKHTDVDEPVGQASAASTGGIPGFVWGILGAVAVVLLIVVLFTMLGGSSEPTTADPAVTPAVAVAADPAASATTGAATTTVETTTTVQAAAAPEPLDPCAESALGCQDMGILPSAAPASYAWTATECASTPESRDEPAELVASSIGARMSLGGGAPGGSVTIGDGAVVGRNGGGGTITRDGIAGQAFSASR